MNINVKGFYCPGKEKRKRKDNLGKNYLFSEGKNERRIEIKEGGKKEKKEERKKERQNE